MGIFVLTLLITFVGPVHIGWAQPEPATTIKNASGRTIFELKTNGELTLPSDPLSGTNTRFAWRPSSGALLAGAGTQASAFGATALNLGTTASGLAATALGANTTAQSFASLVIGQYNTLENSNPNFWDYSDPLFVAGNALGPSQRSNALPKKWEPYDRRHTH